MVSFFTFLRIVYLKICKKSSHNLERKLCCCFRINVSACAPSYSLGVSIIDGDKNGITMELDMQWDGNPNIVLGVKTLVGVSLPIQVQDMCLMLLSIAYFFDCEIDA